MFKKAGEAPKLLIVTDKLLTGFDAPVLYCMYLDKPMRDHVLLQAIARVNRPYVDTTGISKPIGLVVDFVGVLRELRKALQFDSSDVSGVIEDLDLLMRDFRDKIVKAKTSYLDDDNGGRVAETRAAYPTAGGGADERLEQIVYTRFLNPEARKEFFSAYKEIEALWEILSPSAELRNHIATFRASHTAIRRRPQRLRRPSRLRGRPGAQDPAARGGFGCDVRSRKPDQIRDLRSSHSYRSA